MFECKDQLGRTVILKEFPPRRIVSLVPSQTELLYDLGLKEQVVGITKFCVHPDHWFRSKERIGGTKNVNIHKVKSLLPDLILANKEENVREQIDQLETIAPVWTSDVGTVEDALQMIMSIGDITGTSEKALSLTRNIATSLSRRITHPRLAAAYLIWYNPYMSIGGDTFINDMLNKCGFQNVFDHLQRYPAITLPELVTADPRLILLSSEPYPFKEKHVEEIERFFSNTTVTLVDGEMFSWYGSRMLHAGNYFRSLMQAIER